ncbi:hypothetical protein [Alteromonas sp. KUL49]|uniref:hypothetical protein n=1 Tax=Alteromonas sp. KUL49 TaxID=2480798 RepID=UPI00102F0836|nr:hypothetical protein [Alteromonas sp. KUL49]TAP40356.1 hypothetical protein EYS00_09360 [Alteromonas sp. KUL49]GEA11506.1 hypothetical protein KUL49_18810 [Alteromonas sp. KUL49]
MVQRLFTHSLYAVCTLGSAWAMAQLSDTTEATPIENTHFGTAVYSLYTDDPLSSLSALSLAKFKGVSEAQGKTLDLLEGGIALSYDMPELAQRHLNEEALSDHNEPLALYWLSRLNFSQGRLQQGLTNFEQFTDVTDSSDIEALLTPAQWYALNYEGAQASLALGQRDVKKFKDAIPSEHINQQYLHYNEGVVSHINGDTESALIAFKQIEETLHLGLQKSSAIGGLFDWVTWWQLPEDSSVTEEEREALLNEVYLTQGQLLLSQGKLSEALVALSNLNPNDSRLASRHDEVLLNYAWKLAQSGDWPNAMGIWSYLSSQPVNMFTLQATHALAVGYSAQGGEVQAFETLAKLNQNISQSMNDLDILLNAVEVQGYWREITRQVQALGNDGDEALKEEKSTEPGAIVWPDSHHDIFLSLLNTVDNGDKEETEDTDSAQPHRFNDLASLYAIRNQLLEQKKDIGIFHQLLDERDQVHQNRVVQNSGTYVQHQIAGLVSEYESIQSMVNASNADIETANNINDLLSGLAVFASPDQRSGLTRLLKAQNTKTLVAEALALENREIRPAYTTRLDRLMGILLWELHEQYPKAKWETHQHLQGLAGLLAQANEKHDSFTALLTQGQVNQRERQRLGDIEQLLQGHLNTTESLIAALENVLTKDVRAAIADRKSYLSEQFNVNRLAMIQLQDSRNEEAQ